MLRSEWDALGPAARALMAQSRTCIGETIVDGEQGKLQAADNADLVENVREMMFHGVFTEGKLARNLLVAQAGNDGGQNFHLALRQTVVAWRFVTRGASPHVVHDVAHSFAPDPILPSHHGADGLHQQL